MVAKYRPLTWVHVLNLIVKADDQFFQQETGIIGKKKFWTFLKNMYGQNM